MISTIYPHEALFLPGVLPGILEDYRGPVLGPVPLRGEEGLRQDVLDGETFKGLLSTYGGRLWAPIDIRLSMARKEVQFRVATWLAMGEPCPDCAGSGFHAGVTDDGKAPAAFGCLSCGGDGSRVKMGTGHRRAPTPVWWALPGPSLLEDWVACAVLYTSVLRRLGGLTAVEGVLKETRWGTAGCLPGETRTDFNNLTTGAISFSAYSGKKKDGRQDKRAEALSLGYALLSEDNFSLRVELPEAIVLSGAS